MPRLVFGLAAFGGKEVVFVKFNFRGVKFLLAISAQQANPRQSKSIFPTGQRRRQALVLLKYLRCWPPSLNPACQPLPSFASSVCCPRGTKTSFPRSTVLVITLRAAHPQVSSDLPRHSFPTGAWHAASHHVATRHERNSEPTTTTRCTPNDPNCWTTPKAPLPLSIRLASLPSALDLSASATAPTRGTPKTASLCHLPISRKCS